MRNSNAIVQSMLFGILLTGITGLGTQNMLEQIGKHLFLSHWTIKDHRKRLISKMSCANATSAVRRGFELGILPLQENYATVSLAS